jgi:hypothetical protein
MPTPESWIDLSEIARLVARILPEETPADTREDVPASPPRPLVASPETFPWQFDPATSFPDLDEIPLPADPDQESLSPPDLKRRAAQAMRSVHGVALDRRAGTPPAPSPPAASASPPPGPAPGSAHAFPIPDAPLRERLRAFAEWTRRVTGCASLRIVDAQGYSLLEESPEHHPEAVAAALQLMASLERIRHQLAAADATRHGLYLPLGDQEWFGVLECATSSGRVCLSLVTRAPLAQAAAAELTDTLRRTVDAA